MNKATFSLTLALACLGAPSVWAQNPINPASAPDAIGTTQPKANEAMRGAVPRSDTGTVVRTGESAAQAASAALSSASAPMPHSSPTPPPSNGASPATGAAAPTSPSTNADASAPAAARQGTTRRAPRADRN